MRNFVFAYLFAAIFASTPLHAQQTSASGAALVAALDNPQSQWVFNHLCIPVKLLEGKGFTRSDFIAAYMIVSAARWQSSLDTLSRGDEKESMRPVGQIVHSVIDAYWPNRVQRDATGAITDFQDCDRLGNLPGVLREERIGSGPAPRDEVVQVVAEVLRKWKERRPFDEVVPLLLNGPMKLSPAASSQPLSAK